MPTKNKKISSSNPSNPSTQERSSFFNFTRWVKDAILRKSKSIVKTTTTTNSNENRAIVRRHSSRRSLPAGKRRRRSRKSNRRRSVGTYLSEKNKNKDSIIINDKIDDNYNDNNNNVVSKNKNNDNINNSWVKDEILNNDDNKDEMIIISNIKSDLLIELKSDNDVYEIPCKDSISSDDSSSSEDDSKDSKDSRDDFVENTRIIRGSVEHFAYVRTLRKLRRDRQRPTNQVILLNNILEKVSNPSKLSDELRKELDHYKTRVYELNRLKRNSIFMNNDMNSRTGPYYSFNNNNNSISSLCPTSLMSKRLSEIMAEKRPISPITMKYRPSYASSKVVTIFDDESNQLIVKELPVARRKRRLSDLSNILIRSTTTSSTTSTNSSQSSLVTLTDDVEQLKYSTLCKEPETFLSNHIIIKKDDSDNDGDEDDVPLFVLKEQFKYSGRGYGLIKNNNFPSLERNRPPCMTLAV